MEDKSKGRPRVSVVTINYNNAAGLELTARSIAAQQPGDWEWVVIDGGSADGSRQVMQRYEALIAYGVSEPDSGIYNAMNKGVEAAKGDYLLFINSGDRLHDPSTLTRFIERRSTEDVVYGRVVLTDSEGREVGHTMTPPYPLTPSYFWHNNLCHQGIFFSRRCFERHRYNETLRISSDFELVFTLLYERYVFAPYDEFIAEYDTSGVSSTQEGKTLRDREFEEIRSRVLAPGVKADIEQLFRDQDVDISVMARDIVNSRRWIRHLARVVLYPVHALTKLYTKSPSKRKK